MRTANDWCAILSACEVDPSVAATWSTYFAEAVTPGSFSLGESEVDDFVGNVLHESGRLKRLEEDLYYKTPERIMAVWPRRFPTIADATPYVRDPVKLAVKVYGDRMGNVNPGDAWMYRGSGPIMVTGRDNFDALQRATGIPLLRQPDLLRKPGVEALKVCIAWWEGHVPDSVMGDRRKVRRSVNGGDVGLADTIALSEKAAGALA